MTTMHQAAQELAERGYYLFPLATPIQGGGCSCGDKNCTTVGKHPRIQQWQIRATTDLSQIDEWWTMWPTANIGLATGAKSRCWVLDVDPQKLGNESLEIIRPLLPNIAETLCAWTGGGGLHFYFTYPTDGTAVRNKQAVWPGIDIRGEGGYVVAPPSLHRTGLRYEWLKG